MSDLYCELRDKVLTLSLNRVKKHNAFDDVLLKSLLEAINEAIHNPEVRVIVIRANGQHFCAGADLAWMKRMAQYTEAENLEDARLLARVMHTIYSSPKPTIASVQGAAFGGGAGIVAACDIAIATESAQFRFSEVKLGLIPATISPYVIKSIGERATLALFLSTDTFSARRALDLNLVHHLVQDEAIQPFTEKYAHKLSLLPPLALAECKTLVRKISQDPLDEALIEYSAQSIAKRRVSPEAQEGLRAFLQKEKPNWT